MPHPTIAAARAVTAAGGITAVHVQPNSLAEVNAVVAAEEGVTMIVHHYGYAESALDRARRGCTASRCCARRI